MTRYTGAYSIDTGQVIGINVAFEPSLDAAGALTALFVAGSFGSVITPGTLKTVEVYANGSVAIGRWTDGTAQSDSAPGIFYTPNKKDSYKFTANQGLHYAVGSLVSVIPVSGRADYALASATKPTFADGSTAPGTLTSASLAVLFGAVPKIGFEATVVMPEAGGASTYTLKTPGGVANPALNTRNTTIDGFGNFTSGFAVSGSFRACGVSGTGSTTCNGKLTGAFSSDLSGAALVYTISDGNLEGAAAFYQTGSTGVATTVPAGKPQGSSSASGLTDGNNGLASIALASDNGVVLGGLTVPGIAQSYDATGALLSIAPSPVPGATIITRGTAVTLDQQSGPGWAVGRWASGSVFSADQKYGGYGTALYGAGSGFHYVSFAKPTGTLPTGLISYVLGGATSPTYSDGRLTTASAFTGTLGIDTANAGYKVGLQGQIATTDAAGANTFAFTTPGGAAAPSVGVIAGSALLGGGVAVAATGHDCVTSKCFFNFGITNGGDSGALAAVTYFITDAGAGTQLLEGAALFTKSGFVAAPPPPVIAVQTPVAVQATSHLTGQTIVAKPFMGYNPSGDVFASPGGYLTGLGLTSSNEPSVALGTAKNYDSGGVPGVLGWTRWSNGGLIGSSALPEFGGYGILWGARSVSVPNTGLATYALIGSTAPILAAGGVAPGTVKAASFAVDFGTRKVGFSADLNFNGVDFSLLTAGGIATPSVSLDTNAVINGFSGVAAVNGNGCTASGATQCRATFDGFLAGPSASNAGLSYEVLQTVGSGQTNIGVNGTLAFGNPKTVPSATIAPPPAPVTTEASYYGAGFGSNAGQYTLRIDNLGNPVSTTSMRAGTATITNGTITADYVIGRYANGTVETFDSQGATTSTAMYGANDGLHFAFARTRPPALPTTGTAQFGFASFTMPTFADKSVVTGASLTGGISVAFGTQPKYGIAGILALTDAGTAQRYEFQSAGGLATPSLSSLLGGASLPAGIPVTTTDSRCIVNCSFIPNFAIGGATGNIIAGTYQIGSISNNLVFTNLLTGAAVASSATPVGATPVVPPVPTTTTGQTFSGFVFGVYSGGLVNSTVTAFDGGKLESYTNQGTTITRGTTTNNESGSVPGVLSWTRWAGGVTDGRTIPANGGQNYIWGTGATALPLSGTATYSLIGSTAPQSGANGIAVGVVRSAALAVDFVTQKIGFDALIGIGGSDYTLATNGGGASKPLLAFGLGSFSGFSDQVSVTGGACTVQAANCTAQATGFFAGPAGSHVGLGYDFTTGSNTGTVFGTLAFAQSTFTQTPEKTLTNQIITGTNSVFTTAGFSSAATIIAADDGRLASVIGRNTVMRGTNTDNENGGIAGVIGWTRWAGGTTAGFDPHSYSATSGIGLIWGSPATAVPTAGTASYAMIGATAPQIFDSNTSATSLGAVKSASLGVDFGTRKLGVAGVITAAGTDYAFTSAGGVGAPSIALTVANGYSGSGSVTGGTNTAATPAKIDLAGFLAGPGASAAALTYGFNATSRLNVSGTISFKKGM